MSCKGNFSLTEEPVLMELKTIAVKDLRICMKGNNPGPNYHNGDNSREIIISANGVISLIWHTVLVGFVIMHEHKVEFLF